MTPRLYTKYQDEIVSALTKELGIKNIMEVPKLSKITVNMGVGEAVQDIKQLDSAVKELATITGQKAVITKAKRSIATYKLREGMPIGACVTLRRTIMWEFLDRLITIALPRVRDFRGLSPRAFDGLGNYSLGIREQIIFPEINYDSISKVRGLNISLTTTAKNDQEGLALLKHLGFPFRN